MDYYLLYYEFSHGFLGAVQLSCLRRIDQSVRESGVAATAGTYTTPLILARSNGRREGV